jgi:RNA polymerase sigma factor (sigma-70 family)
MAALNLYGLFRRACRVAAPYGIGVPSDSELVNRIVSARDEAAFEVIVWRHGPMVLSVCRRVLRNEQDAEDAFQATFLTFVRKAAAISQHRALAGWLYRVAHRICLRALDARTRRDDLEKRRAARSLVSAETDQRSLELKELLDAELDRLPERYRVPVVLCYLQGRTTEEVARELGCARGTVLSRLARARERLRGRLLRRGVSLTAGTFPVVLSENGAPALVPVALVEKTVRTGLASGLAPIAAPVAALSSGMLKTMLLTRLKFLGALTAAVFVVAGAGIWVHRALAERPSRGMAEPWAVAVVDEPRPQPKPFAKPKHQTHPITVTGMAVDARGKPLNDATIYLLSTNGIDAVVGSTKTDGDGHYAFKDAPLPVNRPNAPGASLRGTFQVYGTATGYGFAWHGMRSFLAIARPADFNPAGEDYDTFLGEPLVMNLQFHTATRLYGQLADESGKPIKGAKVAIRNADYFDIGNKESHINFREFWGLHQVEAKRTTAMTDETGRFRLDGLPPEVCFWVHVEHPVYAALWLYAVTTDRAVTERDYQGRKQVVHSGPLSLTLLKPRRITLGVVYDDTGKPAAGIRVATSGSGADAIGYSASGTTDAQGQLLLKLPPGEYPLVADPKGDLPYIRTPALLTVSKISEEQTGELRMNPGCILILKAVDAGTGKGIPQIRFACATEDDPRNWVGIYGDTGWVAENHSDVNGKVRVVLAPGKRNFKVGWPMPAGYEAVRSDEDLDEPGTRAVKLPAGETVTVTFKLRKK